MSKKVVLLLVHIGAIILGATLVAGLAPYVGIYPGFGIYKMIAAIIGLLILGVGLFFYFMNKKKSVKATKK